MEPEINIWDGDGDIGLAGFSRDMGALASLSHGGAVSGLLDLTLRCTKEVQALWKDPFYAYKFWRQVCFPSLRPPV